MPDDVSPFDKVFTPADARARRTERQEPPGTEAQRAPFTVVYLDNHLLVVVKPAGLLSQADHTARPDLVNAGKAYIKSRFNKPGRAFCGLVHRLDHEVSGVMVLARTSKAAARLSEQFRERSPSKRYLALVEGRLLGSDTETDHLLKKHGHVKTAPASHPKSKKAVLHWTSKAVSQRRTLVEVELVTGRAHQIRVQLSELGHPVMGDDRYGAQEAFPGGGIALHAVGLTIEHPTLRRKMTFTAPPPHPWTGFFDARIRAITGVETFGRER